MRRLRHDPGSLRHRVEIQQASLTTDGAGGHSESWSTLATVFAAIEPTGATSTFGANQRLERVTHRVTIRWRADVASGMRLVHDGRILDIRTVRDPDETARYLTLEALEEGR